MYRADYDPDKSSGTDIDITPLPSDEINFPPGILNIGCVTRKGP